jgi:predicted O-methyltransferase YrrM
VTLSLRVRKKVHRLCTGPAHALLHRRLRRLMRQGSPLTESEARRLVRLWWNGGWTCDPQYLAAIAQAARTSAGPILECGSGLSTLITAIYAHTPLVSLESSPVWAANVNAHLRRLNLPESVIYSPLREHGDLIWYEAPPQGAGGQEFTMIICDGPPSLQAGEDARFGVLPVMRHRLAPGALIFADDADRPAERRAIEAWIERFGCTDTGLSAGRGRVLRTPSG